MKNGGWVFISHSHQDIELVRKIRNHLEMLGFEPLMFFLKCLSDENEIEELIKREIDERDWFIYADSPNARASNWVKTEREYIESLDGKNVFTIDLKSSLDEQLKKIEHIARQMKVFISCSRKDYEIKEKIKEKLISRDLMVFGEEDLYAGSSWDGQTESAIAESARNGFVLLILSKSSVDSQYVKDELRYAQKCNAKIIPVYVDDARLSSEMFDLIADMPGINISTSPSDSELERLLNLILSRVEYYESDYKSTYGFRSAKTIHLPRIARIDNMTLFECECLECLYIPDTVIYITQDAFEDFPNLLIKCTSGSYAESYCIRHGIRYEIVEKSEI